jgi:hypothetical protein
MWFVASPYGDSSPGAGEPTYAVQQKMGFYVRAMAIFEVMLALTFRP